MIYFEDKVHVFYFLKKLSKWLYLLEKWVNGSFFFFFFFRGLCFFSVCFICFFLLYFLGHFCKRSGIISVIFVEELAQTLVSLNASMSISNIFSTTP